mgnify:CR=1 FL=1
MKKITTLLVLVLGSLVLNAQNFRGTVTYVSKTSTEDMMPKGEATQQIPEEMMKMIQEQMKKISEKTFTLHFDKDSSVYEEEVVLEAGADNPMAQGFRMMSNSLYGGVYYKNVKEKTFIQEREFFGKDFLVKDSLQVFEWELGTETKQIGNYTCFKATATVPFNATDFKNMTRKEPKDEKEKEKLESSTNFLDMIDIPEEIIVTAWYTPEIPVSQGPSEYWGLPGLIMEVSSGKTTVLCSKIVINPKDKKEIKAPRKGTVVTQKEYQDIMMKKMEEFQQMGRGQGGGRFQVRTR